MGDDMVSQREERMEDVSLKYIFKMQYFKIIADFLRPLRTILNWGYILGVKVKIHVCVLAW